MAQSCLLCCCPPFLFILLGCLRVFEYTVCVLYCTLFTLHCLLKSSCIVGKVLRVCPGKACQAKLAQCPITCRYQPLTKGLKYPACVLHCTVRQNFGFYEEVKISLSRTSLEYLHTSLMFCLIKTLHLLKNIRQKHDLSFVRYIQE